MATRAETFLLQGGVNHADAVLNAKPGGLLIGKNVECVLNGGYRRLLGYEKFDTTTVPGEGDILGIHIYNGKAYAFRNAVGGATAEMHESSGSGWTTKKTGLTAGGDYRFVNAYFQGSTKMYGVSGVHKAFQWDGTTWTDITTGMTSDTPNELGTHRNYLWLGFSGSLQYSPLGNPTGTWTLITGAGEMAMESNITGIKSLPGGKLGVFCRQNFRYLEGSSTSDFVSENMYDHGNYAGAISDSVQLLGQRVVALDDRGVSEVIATDRFGDFVDATLSSKIDDLVQSKKNTITGSCVVRDKSQYRVFFSDGTGLIFSFKGEKMIGITTTEFPLAVKKIVSAEDSGGSELILFGSTDGYIYKMESGNSFGGTAIDAYMRLNFYNYKRPLVTKRFRRVTLDIKGYTTSSGIKVACDAILSDSVAELSTRADISAAVTGSLLGTGALNSFILSSSYLNHGEAEINTHGTYMSLIISSSTTTPDPWQIDGVVVTYSERKLRRGH